MIRKRIHQTTQHVWSKDPALDQAALGRLDEPEGVWQKFLKSGDVASLPLANGAKAAVFKLTSLSREQLLAISDIESPLRRHDATVGFGLVGVTGMVDEHDRPMEIEHEPWRGGTRVKAKSLEDLFYVDLIQELGQRLLEISRPDPM